MVTKIVCLLFFAIGANCFPADNDDPDIENMILGENPDEDSKSAIVGGEYIDIEATPYLIQLYVRSTPICGGSIVSEEWIITAAHCLADLEEEGIYTKDLSILTGATVQGHGKRYKVLKTIVHERYRGDIVDNDIALIKVQGPIIFNERQKPIEVSKQLPKSGDILQVTGFGKEGNTRRPSRILKTTYVNVLDQRTCKYSYPRGSVTSNMFCATFQNTDSCQGDSGGPAVINGKLVGIVSWGYECASDIHPGVYTELLNYKDWIKQRTNLEL